MKKRILIALGISLTLLLLLIIIMKFMELINFKCIFKHLFGIYCAGCGTTRMIKSLFSFQFYQAFRYNPFVFILLAMGILYALCVVFIYVKTGKVKPPSFKVLLIIIALLFIYMILRNIPGFEFLRPTILS